MSRTRVARRVSVVVAALLISAGPTPYAGSAAPAPDRSAPAAAGRTALTLTIANCAGCTVTAVSASSKNYRKAWSSPPAKVENDTATIMVPTAKTANLSLSMTAPWEKNMGYVTMVVMRYQGQPVGSTVTPRIARTKKRGAGCWAGTTERTASMTIRVKKVRVEGNGGKTDGTLAFVETTPAWLKPMLPVWGGVAGAQDVLFCKPAA